MASIERTAYPRFKRNITKNELRRIYTPTLTEDLSAISPYLTVHIKRFGDYVIDLEEEPQPLDGKLGLEQDQETDQE